MAGAKKAVAKGVAYKTPKAGVAAKKVAKVAKMPMKAAKKK